MVIIRRTRVSEGARALADALRSAGVVARLSYRNMFRPNRLVINWGSTEDLTARQLLNKPAALSIARNKLQTFEVLRSNEVNVPEFWSDRESAEAQRNDSIILERHTLTGESGAGIVVKREGEELSNAPLYVRYVRKEKEYRVHVFKGKAIFVQEKRRESDAEQSRDQALLRNRDNGWVFCVQNVSADDAVLQQAARAVDAVGLDFGAVDIVVCRRSRVPYVLEINTKPGLSSPSVLEAYVNAIKEHVNGSASG